MSDPISREQKLVDSIAGTYTGELEPPQSRIEVLLYNLNSKLKSEQNNGTSGPVKITFKTVDSISDVTDEGVIYFVKNEHSDNDRYDEYVFIDGKPEYIGGGGSADTSKLAKVATSGDYNDLINKPKLSTVALSGKYEDLLDKPSSIEIKRLTKEEYDDLQGTSSTENTLYYITDYKTDSDGKVYSAIAIGDGNAYVGDLPLDVGLSAEEESKIATIQKIKDDSDKKVSANVDSVDPELLVLA